MMTVSLATSLSVAEKGFGVKACIDVLRGRSRSREGSVGLCGLIFIWLLGSQEKQVGICAHKAMLKARVFEN